MTLVKFKSPRLPWYDTMFRDLLGSDRMLTNDFFLENNWVPAMNVKETKDKFDIEIAAPGFNKKDFQICRIFLTNDMPYFQEFYNNLNHL